MLQFLVLRAGPKRLPTRLNHQARLRAQYEARVPMRIDITASPSPSDARSKLRLRLSLELGLLISILAIIFAMMPIGRSWMQDLTNQNLADRELSHYTTEIVVQALLCRRYEKDVLLNLSDPAARDNYLSRWNQATLDLELAIQGFGAAAATAPDRAQAEAWRAQSATYRAAVLQIIQKIDQGSITLPQEANALLAPSKDSIRSLTESAMQMARAKETAVQSSSDAVSSATSSNARMIVLIGLVGLILVTLRYRR
jgi:hypothetical protein